MRVLIAEDDSLLAEGLARSLRDSGYAVDCVNTGAEADSATAAFEFDLLILDLNLPKMSGLEVLKRLRSRSRELPVLILTGQSGVEDRLSGEAVCLGGTEGTRARAYAPYHRCAHVVSTRAAQL